MEQQIETIKSWLGTGCINIFGLPYSGKDTLGVRLAETLGARFLSSGLIIRHAIESDPDLKQRVNSGLLAPTSQFYELVLPYFSRQDLANSPLILASIGRWSGEEDTIISSAEASNHPIKAALLLNISPGDVKTRWEQLQILDDRGDRGDDKDPKVINTRIDEFNEKTMPVIDTYKDLGLLVHVNADQPKDDVFVEAIRVLANYAKENSSNES